MWIDRRTRLESESRLNHKRLYILPSKAGLGFLVLVAAKSRCHNQFG